MQPFEKKFAKCIVFGWGSAFHVVKNSKKKSLVHAKKKKKQVTGSKEGRS